MYCCLGAEVRSILNTGTEPCWIPCFIYFIYLFIIIFIISLLYTSQLTAKCGTRCIVVCELFVVNQRKCRNRKFPIWITAWRGLAFIGRAVRHPTSLLGRTWAESSRLSCRLIVFRRACHFAPAGVKQVWHTFQLTRRAVIIHHSFFRVSPETGCCC